MTPSKLAAPASSRFLRSLLDRRRAWDVYPWLEVQAKELAINSPIGSVMEPEFKLPYALQIEAFTYSAFHGSGPDRLAFRNLDAIVRRTVSTQIKDEASRAFKIRTVFGEPEDEWRRFTKGFFLEANKTLGFSLTTTAVVGDALALKYQQALRGYRLYPAGSIQPAQKTRAEWEASGYTFKPFRLGVRVTNGTVALVEVSTELVFDRTFLIDRIIVAKEFETATFKFTDVKIEADRPLMNDWVNWHALGGEKTATEWSFPLPITVNKGTRWVFKARPAITAAATETIDFVIEGDQLVSTTAKKKK